MVVESMECFDMGVVEYDVKLVRKPTFCLQTNLTLPNKGHNGPFWAASLSF
jgi:hypothetical protein